MHRVLVIRARLPSLYYALLHTLSICPLLFLEPT